MFRQHLLGFFRLLKRCIASPRLTAQRGTSRNIVVLGSLGVGKSALVNMLVGRAVAPVSGGIDVVHQAVVEYAVSLSAVSVSGDAPSSRLQPSSGPDRDLSLRLFDTVGLEHRPSPWAAIRARVKRSGGVDLVVYCMRRGRLSSEQVTHLRDIWNTYCRGGIPLVLVVSGIDFRRGSTEKWWEENGEDLQNMVDVGFADHICLNTCDPAHPSWRHQAMRYEEAQRLVRDLVTRHCKNPCSGST